MCIKCHQNMSDEMVKKQLMESLDNPRFELWNMTSLNHLMLSMSGHNGREVAILSYELLKMYDSWLKESGKEMALGYFLGLGESVVESLKISEITDEEIKKIAEISFSAGESGGSVEEIYERACFEASKCDFLMENPGFRDSLESRIEAAPEIEATLEEAKIKATLEEAKIESTLEEAEIEPSLEAASEIKATIEESEIEATLEPAKIEATLEESEIKPSLEKTAEGTFKMSSLESLFTSLPQTTVESLKNIDISSSTSLEEMIRKIKKSFNSQ